MYDSIKNNNGSNSLIQSMNIIKRSRDNVAGSVLISADFSMNGATDHSVYLPNGKVLINDNAYFKYSDEVFEGLKEIHEFYVECEKRLLDLVENYNKRLADNYKWFDELLKDPNVANDPDMKNILSGVKESSTDSAKHITELSSKILKYTQELEKVILKMSSK